MNAVLIRKTIAAAAVTLLLTAQCVAAGQELPLQPGDDPVLQALIAEALARNPDVAAAQAAIKAAHARSGQVSSRPDPMVSMNYTNDGWSPSLGSMPMTTLGVMVSQDLPYSGKRKQRMEVAMSDARRSEPQLARVRLSIEADVTRAYYGLLLARELAALTGEQRELWRQIESVAR